MWDPYRHVQQGSAQAAAAHAAGAAVESGKATLPRRGPGRASAHWIGPSAPGHTGWKWDVHVRGEGEKYQEGKREGSDRLSPLLPPPESTFL